MANGALSTQLNNMNCLRSASQSHLQCFSFSWVLSGCWIAFGIFSLLAHFWTLNCRKRKMASLRNCSATSIVTFAQGSRRPRQIRCLMQTDYDCCCFNCQNLQIKWRYKCLEQNIGYQIKILHLSQKSRWLWFVQSTQPPTPCQARASRYFRYTGALQYEKAGYRYLCL